MLTPHRSRSTSRTLVACCSAKYIAFELYCSLGCGIPTSLRVSNILDYLSLCLFPFSHVDYYYAKNIAIISNLAYAVLKQLKYQWQSEQFTSFHIQTKHVLVVPWKLVAFPCIHRNPTQLFNCSVSAWLSWPICPLSS